VRGAAALACIAALGACGGGTADNRQGGGDSTTAAVSPAATEAPQGAPPAGTGAQAPVAGAMSDANIAAVASASNQDEIETSRVALQKGENAGVKQYAQRMVDDHTRMEQEMTQLLQSKGMTPQDNPQSTQIKQTAQAAVQQMQAMTGRQLDSAYVAHQVQSHQATLQALETTLIPNARDPQVKALLEKARPAVAAHLADAQKLQGTLR
jgi:putative membrane protein